MTSKPTGSSIQAKGGLVSLAREMLHEPDRVRRAPVRRAVFLGPTLYAKFSESVSNSA